MATSCVAGPLANQPTHFVPLHPFLPRLQFDAVERFVVAHGQIILNQFQNYPGAPAALVWAAAAGTALVCARIAGLLLLSEIAAGRACCTSWQFCSPFVHSASSSHHTPSTNSFLPHAVKEVRNSAFVAALKERMAQLRHSKLYKQVRGRTEGGGGCLPGKQLGRWEGQPLANHAALLVCSGLTVTGSMPSPFRTLTHSTVPNHVKPDVQSKKEVIRMRAVNRNPMKVS